MNTHITKDRCTGCLACENICPRGAISHDLASGFIRPAVNEAACVNCGLCLRVCPKDRTPEERAFLQQAYAVKHPDVSVLRQSTSGGAFSAIADCVLKEKGVIYGCVLENGSVQHVRTEGEYQRMRGSKYVQSNPEKVYADLALDLVNGKEVLFTGAPCQCAGVKNFLSAKNIATENLILVDFVCHGVTSPALFRDYLAYCEKKTGKKIGDHLFRSKVNGWTKHTEMNVFSDGTADCQSYESQLYKSVFHSRYGMNECCFDCRFASTVRVSDITLADFWGVNKSRPELFDPNGVSFVLINSGVGQRVMDRCDHLEKHPVSVADTEQPSLRHPAEKPPKYNRFWRDYRGKGFYRVVRKYYRGGKLYRALSGAYHRLLRRGTYES